MKGRVCLPALKKQLECCLEFCTMDNMLLKSWWISKGIKCGIGKLSQTHFLTLISRQSPLNSLRKATS